VSLCCLIVVGKFLPSYYLVLFVCVALCDSIMAGPRVFTWPIVLSCAILLVVFSILDGWMDTRILCV
jgi:hypothetical protein